MDHLLGEGFRLFEPLSKEHDLGDETVVGDHHADGTEEHFEVVGELGAAGVTGVHCYEYAAIWTKLDVAVAEQELGVAFEHGYTDCEDLLGDNR